MDQQFEDRLATVERALTDGETDLADLTEGAARAERVADLADRLDALEDEVAELDAATQALRGYVGEVRSVNESVEETAAAAMAKAEQATSDEGTAGASATDAVSSDSRPADADDASLAEAAASMSDERGQPATDRTATGDVPGGAGAAAKPGAGTRGAPNGQGPCHGSGHLPTDRARAAVDGGAVARRPTATREGSAAGTSPADTEEPRSCPACGAAPGRTDATGPSHPADAEQGRPGDPSQTRSSVTDGSLAPTTSSPDGFLARVRELL